jgi:phage/plasmid primase-like uncharacterized protein
MDSKAFQLRCEKCRWSEFSSGLTKDLAHLHEIKKCATCGGKRKFRCPKCGGTMDMKRLPK